MKSKRVVDIETKFNGVGGASASCRMNFDAPKDSAQTAVAQAMLFLNDYAERMGLTFYLAPHDRQTKAELTVMFNEE